MKMSENADLKKIKELVARLNKAAKAYYQDGREIMPNIEYDRLYDELVALEKETGIVLSTSPTVNVGYEVATELPKEEHPSRMLSLDKTKSREELRDWLGEQKGLLSWKLDGLTVVLTYEGGTLVKALTRGNGQVGEVITQNAKAFVNVPLSIPHEGRLVLRGEALIRYSDFERINASMGEAEAVYKNPRNLCSGSVRQLDAAKTRERCVNFFAFGLVEGGPEFAMRSQQLEFLASMGFECVHFEKVAKDNIIEKIDWFEKEIETNDLPSDGLVLLYDDIEYGRSLGETTKFPKDSIAFKWQDQLEETVLREVLWSASRTGLINPIAVFDPVELEGTTVTRASLHNISIMEELKLGIGDRITVYKANMIIPQIQENLTGSGNLEVPDACPVCGEKTRVAFDEGSEVKTLHCDNADCPAKKIKSFTLFVSRDAMNIEGLSESTLEKLVDRGFVKEPSDLFKLERYRAEIQELEGFGEKSFENLLGSLEKARKTEPARVLFSLGVPGIGLANARVIARAAGNSWEKMMSLTREELLAIDGVGEVMADAYLAHFADEDNMRVAKDLLEVVELDERQATTGDLFSGLTFVITGSLEHYENRDALKAEIEKQGGKVAGSVSGSTSYLINNNVASTSGKNKKAKELGIPIVDEEKVIGWMTSGILE